MRALAAKRLPTVLAAARRTSGPPSWGFAGGIVVENAAVRTSRTTMASLLSTTVVGSYPQPDWLVDRENLGRRLPPRVRAREVWKVAPEHLEEAQDAATLAAIRDM